MLLVLPMVYVVLLSMVLFSELLGLSRLWWDGQLFSALFSRLPAVASLPGASAIFPMPM